MKVKFFPAQSFHVVWESSTGGGGVLQNAYSINVLAVGVNKSRA